MNESYRDTLKKQWLAIRRRSVAVAMAEPFHGEWWSGWEAESMGLAAVKPPHLSDLHRAWAVVHVRSGKAVVECLTQEDALLSLLLFMHFGQGTDWTSDPVKTDLNAQALLRLRALCYNLDSPARNNL